MQVPFLNYAYQRTWWQTLGGGEWLPESSHLHIITARENDALIGIAPLFLSSKEGFEPALHFIGSVEVCDYLDFIVEPAKLTPFMHSLLAFLEHKPDMTGKALDLYNLLDHSATLPALQAACEAAGWSFQAEKLQPSPYIVLPETWDEYLVGLGKKQRHEIRRKLRNAEARHETDWYIVQDKVQLAGEMEYFIVMMRKDLRKQAFLTDGMSQYLRLIAQTAFDQGQLHLSFLTMEDHKAAAFMSLLTKEKLWVYNSAWEPAFSPCSPGWVLLAKLIHWAIDQGVQEVDMMRGNESYKYEFGAVDRFVMRAVCKPSLESA